MSTIIKPSHFAIPILAEDLKDRIEDAVQAFLHRGIWKEWGMDKLRDQGAAILFHGPPGTGKTITCYWLGKKLKLRVVEVSMADYGSHVPGELARNIKKIFRGELIVASQNKKPPPIIFLDECDAMLISRKKLGPDMVWLLEPINALLVEISKYPGLVVLATNNMGALDEAIDRRLIAKVRFDRPDEQTRYKLWKAKWPSKFPCQPTLRELEELAEFEMSGAEIENTLILWAGQCMKTLAITPRVGELIFFIANKRDRYFQS
jgi:SpoVK/Ycf46/Vps4 family AAA+-type ATPase